jgi:hypothetical protein
VFIANDWYTALLPIYLKAYVGTLNQGYPLLQYEDTVPVR